MKLSNELISLLQNIASVAFDLIAAKKEFFTLKGEDPNKGNFCNIIISEKEIKTAFPRERISKSLLADMCRYLSNIFGTETSETYYCPSVNAVMVTFRDSNQRRLSITDIRQQRV